MAREFNGTTDRIDYAVAVDAGALGALSVAFWIIRQAGSADREYVLNWEASGAAKHLLWFDATEKFGMILAGTTGVEQYSNAVPADDTREHWCFTWSGGLLSTSIQIFRNGTETGYVGGVTGTGTIAATTSINLGGRTSDDLRNFDGELAELAMWSRVLSAEERIGLAKGFSPVHYPRGLIFAPGLVRNPTCPITGVSGTLDGTTVVAHPRAIYPKRRRIWSPPSSPAALTGTAMASITEADIVAGGKTIIATLSGGATFIPN